MYINGLIQSDKLVEINVNIINIEIKLPLNVLIAYLLVKHVFQLLNVMTLNTKIMFLKKN
jgi:hypothetical protein